MSANVQIFPGRPRNPTFVVPFNAGAFNPADNTTYFLGSLFPLAPTTTATIRRMLIPDAGVITSCYAMALRAAGSPTNESSTISIRLNNSTDTTIVSTLDFSVNPVLFNNGSLSITVAKGDFIEIKWATPAGGWSTAPTTVQFTGNILVEQ